VKIERKKTIIRCHPAFYCEPEDVEKLEAENDELSRQKNAAYQERDNLVAALSKVFPSHLCRHPDSDTAWENDWRWIVCIHAPTGQLAWHIHDFEQPLFSHLEVHENHWDGHSTEEKYRRLALLPRIES
jgi:hypothetical protein